MRKKRHKVFLLLLFTLLLTCLFTTTVFAAEKNLFEVADDIIRDVYGHIVGISTVLACLMTAFAIISAKVSNNQHKSDQAWDWLKRIWLSWAILNLMGAILAYITPLFSGYATLP